ncbi:MAG: ABC transporter permease [Spirochaetaceae bacterium]|nr:MAG: ABC transporter permease [Spirochaetaceae bacterium]
MSEQPMTAPRRAAGTLVAVSAAILVTVILLAIGSPNPARALTSFFLGPFSNRFFFGNMIDTFGLLILVGLGVCAAFRAGVFNLGGEGQVYIAALTTAVVALSMPTAPAPIGILAATGAAVLVAALLAGLSGLFRWAWGTDELITSFLISAALVPTVNFLIVGPLRNPDSNLMTTVRVAEQFRFLRLLPPSTLNVSVGAAVLLAVLAHGFLFSTLRGYELRMTGLNREFARYGGVAVGAYTVLPMAVSGGFHGLAGAFFVLGTHHAAIEGFTAGLGWNGIAVALIGRNHPLLIIPAALVFAYLEAGSRVAGLQTEFTFELAAIIQAVIFFLITAEIVLPKLRRAHRERSAP